MNKSIFQPTAILTVLLCATFLIPFPTHVCASDFFVNDTSTIGDVFTASVGNDTNSGTFGDPFRTIPPAFVVADLRVEPVVINVKSAVKGNGVFTLFIERVETARVSDIAPDSIRILGAPPIRDRLAGQSPVNDGRLIQPVEVTGTLVGGTPFRGPALVLSKL